MPDSVAPLTTPSPAPVELTAPPDDLCPRCPYRDTRVAMEKADGFVVTFEYRSRLGTIPCWDYFERLEGEDGALEAFNNPGAYHAIGISACRGKVPFAALDMAAIHSMTRESRQDAAADARHARMYGRPSL